MPSSSDSANSTSSETINGVSAGASGEKTSRVIVFVVLHPENRIPERIKKEKRKFLIIVLDWF